MTIASAIFMALVAQKGSLSREEQEEISAKLAQQGITMTWNAVRWVKNFFSDGACFGLTRW